MTDLTPDRLAELRRIAVEITLGTYEWRIIETGLALLDCIEALEQELDAARAEAERWRDENEMLYHRIERLEAKVARQRVMLTRLQAAIERRATGDWVEATRRAMTDEVVERYVREADVALDEAEHWRQKYEALRAGVERVIQDLRAAFREAFATPSPYHDGASEAYYKAEQMVRRVLSEAGGGDQ